MFVKIALLTVFIVFILFRYETDYLFTICFLFGWCFIIFRQKKHFSLELRSKQNLLFGFGALIILRICLFNYLSLNFMHCQLPMPNAKFNQFRKSNVKLNAQSLARMQSKAKIYLQIILSHSSQISFV